MMGYEYFCCIYVEVDALTVCPEKVMALLLTALEVAVHAGVKWATLPLESQIMAEIKSSTIIIALRVE